MILLAIIIGLVLGTMLGEWVTLELHKRELRKVQFELLEKLNYNSEVTR